MNEFRYTVDFMTPYNLAEYATGITGIPGIKVEFSNEQIIGGLALVNPMKKTIYLPEVDYTYSLDTDIFRVTKALLCHECAHLMFPDDNVFYCFPPLRRGAIFSLAGVINDLRVENLMGNENAEFREDFKFLVDYVWLEHYSMPLVDDCEMGSGRFGDYSYDLFGSLYWLLQKRYRGANLSPPAACRNILPFKTFAGIEEFLDYELAPLLDTFVSSRKNFMEVAEQTLDLLIARYPERLSGMLPTETI